MHVSALKKKALGNSDKEDILKDMLNICAFDPEPRSLVDELGDCKCLPIRTCLGEIKWESPNTGRFVIVNRKDYGKMFAETVNALNFSLEEAHRLQMLLHALRLEDRYLSKLVKEETAVSGGSTNQKLTNDLRKKAHAICR